jgi:hypothetical protein
MMGWIICYDGTELISPLHAADRSDTSSRHIIIMSLIMQSTLSPPPSLSFLPLVYICKGMAKCRLLKMFPNVAYKQSCCLSAAQWSESPQKC